MLDVSLDRITHRLEWCWHIYGKLTGASCADRECKTSPQTTRREAGASSALMTVDSPLGWKYLPLEIAIPS